MAVWVMCGRRATIYSARWNIKVVKRRTHSLERTPFKERANVLSKLLGGPRPWAVGEIFSPPPPVGEHNFSGFMVQQKCVNDVWSARYYF